MCLRVATGHFDGDIEWGYKWDTTNNMMRPLPEKKYSSQFEQGNDDQI